MAHNIEIVGDKASYFSGESITPWHGLGTVIDGLATAKEALDLANLNWTISLQPTQFTYPDPEEDGKFLTSPIPGRFAAVRSSDNKPLGVVGADYKIFNNEDAFSFFDTVVDSDEAKYTSAGALQGGAKVFMTAKIGDTFTVAGEDEHDMYLLITTSHDGTKAFTAATTMIRAVCQNTVTLALNSAKSKWSLRHKSTLEGKAQEAREALQLSWRYSASFEAAVEELLAIEVTNDQFKAMVSDILPDQKRQKDKNVASLMNIFETEPTVIDAAGAGTAWGALNAMTFWTDHVRESRSPNARYRSLTEGDAASFRNQVRLRSLALV